MFDSLSEKMSKIIKKVQGKSKITEDNISEMLNEVRTSLLEADVNFRVVKEFIGNVKEKAIGSKVYDALQPGEMLVKIVRDELIELLGSEASELVLNDNLNIIMMVGLQGTGKTTSAAKIANLLKNKKDKKVLLVAADLQRPAAIEQLITLGNSIDVEVFFTNDHKDVVQLCKDAMLYSKDKDFDTILFDTAGRLHIDEELMNELVKVKEAIKPTEILLTVDAMSGQDIVNVAKSFNETLEVSGLVATKMDGDSRGGGILSVKSVTNIAVKFVGNGEKINDLDLFYPSRLAERILGMGDILTLVEKVEENINVDEQEKLMERMMQGIFTMEDMLAQLRQIKKLGPLSGIMKMLPGMGQIGNVLNDNEAKDAIKITESIIQSMTLEERIDPSIIRNSRKQRIADGCGRTMNEVNKLIMQFDKTKSAMKRVTGMMGNNTMPDMANFDMKDMAKLMNGKMPGPATGNQKKFVSKLNKKRR